MNKAKQTASLRRHWKKRQDRRSYQRYKLELRSCVYPQAEGSQSDGFPAMTRDISSSGAYLATTTSLSPNHTVRVELIIPLSRYDQQESRGSMLISTGYVIRQEKDGMAIKFYDFQVFSLLDRNQN